MTAARHAARTWTPTGSCASRRPGWAQSHPGTPAKRGRGGGWRGGQMVVVEVGGCAERLLAPFQTRFSPPSFSPTGIIFNLKSLS